MQISGVFVAAGGEDNLTLGNFDVDTATPATPTVNPSGAYSYYYFDDVSVQPLCGPGSGTKTVECGSAWSFDPPVGYDFCAGTNVTVNVLGTVTNGICPATITRTWSLTDLCGNTTNWTEVITIVDTTPPVLTCATNKTVNCGTTWTFDPPTAYDASAVRTSP